MVVVTYLDKHGAWRAMFPTCPFGLPWEDRYGAPYAVRRARELGFVVRVSWVGGRYVSGPCSVAVYP